MVSNKHNMISICCTNAKHATSNGHASSKFCMIQRFVADMPKDKATRTILRQDFQSLSHSNNGRNQADPVFSCKNLTSCRGALWLLIVALHAVNCFAWVLESSVCSRAWLLKFSLLLAATAYPNLNSTGLSKNLNFVLCCTLAPNLTVLLSILNWPSRCKAHLVCFVGMLL